MTTDRFAVFVLRLILATVVLVAGVVIATWPAVLSATTDTTSTTMMLAGTAVGMFGAHRLTKLLAS